MGFVGTNSKGCFFITDKEDIREAYCKQIGRIKKMQKTADSYKNLARLRFDINLNVKDGDISFLSSKFIKTCFFFFNFFSSFLYSFKKSFLLTLIIVFLIFSLYFLS